MLPSERTDQPQLIQGFSDQTKVADMGLINKVDMVC